MSKAIPLHCVVAKTAPLWSPCVKCSLVEATGKGNFTFLTHFLSMRFYRAPIVLSMCMYVSGGAPIHMDIKGCEMAFKVHATVSCQTVLGLPCMV